MKLFELLGKNELIEHERILLEAHNKRMHEIAEAAPLDMLKNINLESLSDGHINERRKGLSGLKASDGVYFHMADHYRCQ